MSRGFDQGTREPSAIAPPDLRQNEPSDDSERYGAKPSGAAQSREPEAPASGARLDTAYVASLDGLRAIAIIGVFGVHAGVPGMRLGWLGVDLFFVLSGFLITSLLLQEYRRTSRISLAKFWSRRFLRLMPAYWLYASFITVLVVVLRFGWLSNHGGWTPQALIASIWLYFSNYLPAGGIWEHQELTIHLWSLAIEEQFYLVWPILCAFLLPRGWLERFAWVLVAATLVGLVSLQNTKLLYGRGFSIVIGCAVASSLARSQQAQRYFAMPTRRALIMLMCILPIVLATQFCTPKYAEEAAIRRWLLPLLCPAFALFIGMLWYGPHTAIHGWLAWRPMVYLGKISYGIYLYHMIAHWLTWNVLLAEIEYWNRWLKYGLRMTLYATLSVGIASLSYRFIERPFLALKARLR
jgi:peptidoglycan/LPS O-acetylase OafA/YrhL